MANEKAVRTATHKHQKAGVDIQQSISSISMSVTINYDERVGGNNEWVTSSQKSLSDSKTIQINSVEDFDNAIKAFPYLSDSLIKMQKELAAPYQVKP